VDFSLALGRIIISRINIVANNSFRSLYSPGKKTKTQNKHTSCLSRVIIIIIIIRPGKNVYADNL
jgi:hypothetical protein